MPAGLLQRTALLISQPNPTEKRDAIVAIFKDRSSLMEMQAQAAAAKEKSEQLLLAILPRCIAER